MMWLFSTLRKLLASKTTKTEYFANELKEIKEKQIKLAKVIASEVTDSLISNLKKIDSTVDLDTLNKNEYKESFKDGVAKNVLDSIKAITEYMINLYNNYDPECKGHVLIINRIFTIVKEQGTPEELILPITECLIDNKEIPMVGTFKNEHDGYIYIELDQEGLKRLSDLWKISNL